MFLCLIKLLRVDPNLQNPIFYLKIFHNLKNVIFYILLNNNKEYTNCGVVAAMFIIFLYLFKSKVGAWATGETLLFGQIEGLRNLVHIVSADDSFSILGG